LPRDAGARLEGDMKKADPAVADVPEDPELDAALEDDEDDEDLYEDDEDDEDEDPDEDDEDDEE